ncbi:MAG: hypothetical protein Kow0099_39180 [Candidatus Abyssubacteria bacterium]
MRRTLPALAILGLCLGVVIFWHVKIVYESPRKVTVETVDLYQQFLPWYSYMGVRMREGAFPLWFPYAGAGMPFLATPSTGVLYPPNWLYPAIPPWLAMGILAQLHLALGGLGMYGFCRAHNLGRSASMLGAFGYVMSNVVWGNFVNPHYLAGVGWMPVVCLCGERLYARADWRNSVLLALAISLQFLAGAGQFFFYTIYFLALYMGLRLVFGERGPEQWKPKLDAALFFGASGALAVLVCSGQLLPSLELLGRSVRGEPLAEESVHFFGWHFPWWRPFLHPLASKYAGFFENLFHMGGLLQVFLVLFSLTRFRSRIVWTNVTLCVLSMLLSTGYSTPLYDYFALLPGVGMSRQPNRLASVTAFALAFLQASGLDAMMRECDESLPRRVKPLLKLLGVAAGYGLVLWLVRTQANLVPLICGTAVLGLGVAAHRAAYLRVAGWVVITLSVWEMGMQPGVLGGHPQILHDYRTPSERHVFEYLRDVAGDERVFIEERGVPPRPFPSVQAAAAGINTIANYHPAILSRMEEMLRAIMGRDAVYPDGRLALDKEAARPDILNILSVRYVLAHRHENIFESAAAGTPMARFARGLRARHEFPDYVLYENTAALPRAYVAHAATVVESPYEALRAVLSESFVPAAVVLEGEGAGEVLPRLATGASRDLVEIASYSPERVVLEASSEAGGMLVLTDTYYPGWRAMVDGAPARIWRANYLFRAVPLPAGSHQVEFVYRPTRLFVGLFLSAVGVAALVVCVVTGFHFRGGRQARIETALSGHDEGELN